MDHNTTKDKARAHWGMSECEACGDYVEPGEGVIVGIGSPKFFYCHDCYLDSGPDDDEPA